MMRRESSTPILHNEKSSRVRGDIEQYHQASRYGYSRRQMRYLRRISCHTPIRVSVDRLKLHLVDLVRTTPVAVGGIPREKLG